jgi:hypothetical protein
MTDHTKGVELAKAAIDIEPIASIYENNEAVRIKFKNKWRNNEVEELCCFMWPCHEIKDTENVESAYENLAKHIAHHNPSYMLQLYAEIDALKSKLEVAVEAFESINPSLENKDVSYAAHRIIDSIVNQALAKIRGTK